MISNWSFLRGGPVSGRYMRYAIVLCVGWLVILALSVAVFLLAPRSYQSGFTLILPGAGSSTSVNLESLGQASSSAESPFGGLSLSPTENYKRLLQSYRLRGQVAETVGATIAGIPPPKVRLANQTKLMFVSVRAASPVEAYRLADAWLSTFEQELTLLRAEEQDLREQAYRATLASFEAAVEEAQARIISFQSKYGLISIEQFRELVAQTETIRLEVERSSTDAQVAQSEIQRLSSLLNISPERAADIMTLLSDGSFQALHKARANAETRRSELAEIFGPNHPELVSAGEEYAGLHTGLLERGRALLGYQTFGAVDQTYYASSDERAALIASLVEAASRLSGARQRTARLQKQLRETQDRVEDLAVPATELDALLRDHQIAETVFASALARIDANRTDIFASYPLTQTVETPARPDAPVTPSKKFIALGAFAGMFLYAIGLALLWIRLPIIRALLKTL